MKKLFLVVLLSIVMSNIFANPLAIDRIIIFGDSLSDTGNFPEPHDYTQQADIPFNLYVPISNPVNHILYGTLIVNPAIKGSWIYPDQLFLTASSSAQGKIDGTDRSDYSINWPQYLIYHMRHQSSVSQPASLLPWIKVFSKQAFPDKYTSIDYAFAGAMTIDGFSDTDQHIKSNDYSEQMVYNLQGQYRNGSSDNYLTIPIPGIRKQIDFYLQDLQSGLVPQNSNTAYVIYIGGNDIDAALVNDLLHFKIKDFICTIKTMAANVQAGVDALIGQANAEHNIYIVTLFDLNNLPKVHSYEEKWPILAPIIKSIVTSLVNHYNNSLISIFNQTKYQGKVTVIPLGLHLNDLANSSKFNHSTEKGLKCDQAAGATISNPSINNCQYDGEQIYFAWNNSHLSTEVNQYTAYEIYGAMLEKKNDLKQLLERFTATASSMNLNSFNR